MLVFPYFPILIALLSHTHHHAAANPPLSPRAETALMPAKLIDGLLGLTARQFFCDPGYGICGNGMNGRLWSWLKSIHLTILILN
jgi:hypothetical protein